MKVFCVSKACNACGECISSTDLLIENAEGFAIPVPGRYIEEKKLDWAKELVKQCPVGALSIVEHSSVTETGKAGLIQLVQVLEKRMRAVEIPNISFEDLRLKESDYKIEHGWVDEYKEEYSSWDKAMNAGVAKFESVYWNHRKDFVTSALTQYKSKVLRRYYDLHDPEHTYYAGIGAKMTAILEEIKGEAYSIGGSELRFPKDFTKFCPERDPWFLKHLEEEYNCYIVSNDYINRFCEGFAREDEQRGRDFRFKGRIVAEEYGQREVKSFFGTSWKPTYRMKDVNETGESMIEHLLDMLSYPNEYGLRSLDDIYTDKLEFVMDEYRKLVDKEISQKIKDLKKVIE